MNLKNTLNVSTMKINNSQNFANILEDNFTNLEYRKHCFKKTNSDERKLITSSSIFYEPN